MALLALPLIVGATREALAQLPDAHARGLLRARQDARDDDPPRAAAVDPPEHRERRSCSAWAASSATRRSSRSCSARTLKNEPVGSAPLLGTLRGTGSTLTSYVYNNSPAGEGNAPQKAYAAAFVLLMIVLALNALVTRLTRRRTGPRGGTCALVPRCVWDGSESSRWTR